MPRKDKEDLEKESKAKAQAVHEENKSQEQESGIVEVPINLELLNNKVNYIITRLDQLINLLVKKE